MIPSSQALTRGMGQRKACARASIPAKRAPGRSVPGAVTGDLRGWGIRRNRTELEVSCYCVSSDDTDGIDEVGRGNAAAQIHIGTHRNLRGADVVGNVQFGA